VFSEGKTFLYHEIVRNPSKVGEWKDKIAC